MEIHPSQSRHMSRWSVAMPSSKEIAWRKLRQFDQYPLCRWMPHSLLGMLLLRFMELLIPQESVATLTTMMKVTGITTRRKSKIGRIRRRKNGIHLALLRPSLSRRKTCCECSRRCLSPRRIRTRGRMRMKREDDPGLRRKRRKSCFRSSAARKLQGLRVREAVVATG